MQPNQFQKAAARRRAALKKGKTAPIHKIMKQEEQAVLQTEKQFHAQELASIGKYQRPRKPKIVQPQAAQAKRFTQPAPPVSQPIFFSSGEFETMNPTNLESVKKLQLQAQARTTAAVNTGMAASSAVRTGNELVDAMFSGMGSSRSRMPDPYTSVRTFSTSVMTNGTISPAFPTSGTSTFGGFAMMVNGSGAKTIGYPYLDANGIASDVIIDWTGTTMTNYNGGINNINFVSRPSGISLVLDVHTIGPVHDIVINAFPILPMSLTYASGPTVYGWPSAISQGLTALQSTWGGRTWTVPANGRLSFAFSPMDNRSFDFEQSNLERGNFDALGQIAWGGWVIWGWGMTTGDKILLRMVYGEECALVTTTTTAFAYPSSRNPANPAAAAAAKDVYSGLLDKGLGAIEYIYDKVAPTASKLYSFLTDDNGTPILGVKVPKGAQLGNDPGCNFTGFLSAMPSFKPTTMKGSKIKVPIESKNPQEVKDIEDCEMPNLSEATKTVNALTDAPEIVTPRNARRPSLALSLTKKR